MTTKICVSTTLSEDDAAFLQQYAERVDRPLSGVVRIAVRAFRKMVEMGSPDVEASIEVPPRVVAQAVEQLASDGDRSAPREKSNASVVPGVVNPPGFKRRYDKYGAEILSKAESDAVRSKPSSV